MIEWQGTSAFMEITAPETGVRLAQAVGRLLRTDQDYGDGDHPRPATGQLALGRSLVQGLPPFRLNIDGRMRNAVCEART